MTVIAAGAQSQKSLAGKAILLDYALSIIIFDRGTRHVAPFMFGGSAFKNPS